MKILNRQETEDLVIDLYFNQRKTFREIQKVVRKSTRDIKAIIDKANPDKSSSFSVSSRAYLMFKEGRNLTDVACTLNLREAQVSEYYKEYWELNGMYYLSQIYRETKDEIWSVIEFYKQMKAAGKNTAHAIRLLEFANNDAPSAEGRITELERKESTLNFRIQRAAKIFQDFNDSIFNEKKTLEQYQLQTRHVKQEYAHLYVEKIKLENFLNYFQSTNDTYLKIREIVKQEIEHVMANPGRLLRFALTSIFESSRRHPGKLQSLYYNMSTADLQSLLRTSIVQNEHDPNQNGQNEDDPWKILLDEAEQVFSKLIDNITGKCANEISNDAKSVSQTEQVSGLQCDMSQEEDYHTSPNACKVEIPVSEVLSNFATQTCEILKITHDQNSDIS